MRKEMKGFIQYTSLLFFVLFSLLLLLICGATLETMIENTDVEHLFLLFAIIFVVSLGTISYGATYIFFKNNSIFSYEMGVALMSIPTLMAIIILAFSVSESYVYGTYYFDIYTILFLLISLINIMLSIAIWKSGDS